MKELIRLFALTAVAACATAIHAAIITVNTTNNVSPGPGETNLFYAISLANTNGDTSNTIKFNIPGAGPHYLKTPTNGYPLITNHNITIDGYSQPGSAPNSNSILAPNNAKIKIVLDSRIDPNSTAFLGTDMNYAPGAGNTGFGAGDVGMLGLFRATNFHAQGLCFLGQFSANYDMFCVAIACDHRDNPATQQATRAEKRHASDAIRAPSALRSDTAVVRELCRDIRQPRTSVNAMAAVIQHPDLASD